MAVDSPLNAEASLAERVAAALLDRPVIWLGILLFTLVLPVRPEIASAANIQLLLLSAALLATLTIGQTFVLVTAGIDLSLPAVISLSSVAGAHLLTQLTPQIGAVPSVMLATAAMLTLGAAVGAAQGWAIARLRMPAFLMTLASLIGVGGLAVWWTQSARMPVTEQFVEIWYGRLLGVPLPLIVVGLLALVAHGTLTRTVIGRRLYAIGHSEPTCRVSGVPIVRVSMFAYAVSGGCAALASVFYTARLYTGSPQLVQPDVLLDCIGGAVIGGASLFGGRGKISGALLGALFIALLGNSLNLLGLRHWHVIMVKGAVILLAALLDVLRSELRNQRSSE